MYQVGNTCYTDKRLAENVYFSQVVPVVTEEGVKQIVHRQDGWYYGSQKLTVEFPKCDPVENYKLGFEAGALLLPTAAVLATTLIVIRLFK